MKNRSFLLGALLTLAAFAASAVLYPRLPAQLPIHWNINGQPDGFGPKEWAAFLMPGFMALMLLFFRVLPWLSPRQFDVESFRDTYHFIMVAMLGLFAYIHGVMLYAGLAGSVDVGRVLVAGIFLFFAVISNVMGKVRRNFWMGYRTPWTLADEQVWNDTHRFAARLGVLLGLACFAAVVAGVPIAIVFTEFIVGVLVPTVYSLARYKQLRGSDAAGRAVWIVGGALLIALAVAILVGTRALSALVPHGVPVPAERAGQAQAFVADMAQGRFDAAEERFAPVMRQGLPPEKLRAEVWGGLTATRGTFVSQQVSRAEQAGPYLAIFVTCRFERGSATLKVVFDREGNISGLWLVG